MNDKEWKVTCDSLRVTCHFLAIIDLGIQKRPFIQNLNSISPIGVENGPGASFDPRLAHMTVEIIPGAFLNYYGTYSE